MNNDVLPQIEKNDDRIDEFGRYFLCIIVEKLDEVLRSSGVATDQRRTICSLFADNLATFLDAGWLQSQNEKLWPVLAFAKRAADTPGAVGEILKLIIQSRESFHSEGGAEGAIARLFDEDKETREWLSFRAGLRGE